ncbi:hypothetical protein INS49_008374 [Diaporthe citri]|uniref:uncharacterized protein n=1 Tax=Diaporthe citri TaxID=83186 RepID=UPI001C80E391|nr:uncharacterized protein INS49_008374 [Diaporthe citri]KAG6363277.1 hypothetical protein INS49_008374 [Diaporthe citri]
MANNVPFYEKAAINNSIGRRLKDLPHGQEDVEVRAGAAVRDHESDHAQVRLPLHRHCNSSVEDSRTSLPIALYSLFRKNVNKITAGIVYDVASSDSERVSAPEYGMSYVLSLRPVKMTLTLYGETIAEKIKESQTGVIDYEKLKERAYTIRDM